MKKNSLAKQAILLLVLVCSALVVLGCKSNKNKDEPGLPRPDWMNKLPKSSDLYYVVGVGREAQTQTAKINIARTDALAQLAQWKSAVVADTMKNYVQESGTVGNTQALQDFEQATIVRSTANVSGFEREDYYVDGNGIYYVLFSYPKSDLRNDFKDSVTSFQRNEAAAFAQFKANEAYKYLETQLDKE